MAIKFTNFASTTLSGGISAVATSLTVAGGTGSRFPTLSGADYFYVTLEDASLNREIVKVTARSTDTFTIVRAQDNTTALAWLTGDSVALRFNAAAISDALALLLANHLAGGANGSVPYQSAADTTAMLAAGTAGQLLQTNGAGAPSWVTALANGMTATTQSVNDNTTKVATTAYADRAASDTQAGRVELATTAEIQTGTDAGRAPSVSSMRNGLLVNGTMQASTSGTTIDFNIPSWAKRITLLFSGVSLSGTDSICVQLGTGGSFETSGYTSVSGLVQNLGTSQTNNGTIGFFVPHGLAAGLLTGKLRVELMDSATNLWVQDHVMTRTDANVPIYGAGVKALSAALTRIRITTMVAPSTAGSNTFDAGSINVLYE